MGSITITFRVPIVNLAKQNCQVAPYVVFRCRDGYRKSCPHKHKKMTSAESCARSMSFGETSGAINEHVEIHGQERSRFEGIFATERQLEILNMIRVCTDDPALGKAVVRGSTRSTAAMLLRNGFIECVRDVDNNCEGPVFRITETGRAFLRQVR